MASRRWQRALAGLGEGLGNLGAMKLRQSMQDASQDRYDDRQARNAEAIAKRQEAASNRALAQSIDAQVAAGTLEPSQAAAMKESLIGLSEDAASFESVRPSPRRRMESKLGKLIMEADAPEKVPSPEDVFGIAEEQGVESRVPAAWSEGMIPADNDPFQNATSIVREYGERAKTRRRALESAPTERFEVENPDGSKQVQFGSKFAAPVQTTPTAQQQGVAEGAKKVATDTAVLGNDALTELRGRAEGRIQQMVENMTRAAKVATASATAGASKRASLAPDIVASEVERGKALAAGKENSTEGERRAATNFAPLVNAHSKSLALEDKGARIGTGDTMMTEWPLLNRMVPAQTQEYMQSARDFVSTLGLIRSGVAVPEAEVNRFMASMFGTTGDGPQNIKNKQATREVFIASMQAMVGRSGDDAGRLMAAAINGGQIPSDILTVLKFEPEIEKALVQHLKGVPQFDINGNVIGTKPK